MFALLGYARGMFWVQGIVFGFIGLCFSTIVLQANSLRSFCWLLLGPALTLGVAAVSCLAARALSRPVRGGRWLVAVASLISLPLFPFGTLAAVGGLYWCCSAQARAQAPAPAVSAHQPKPGDGTHALVQKIMPALSLIIGLGSLALVGWWGDRQHLQQQDWVPGYVRLVLCEWLVVLVHELGHWAAGALVQMRLSRFAAGPLRAEKLGGKWRFQFSWLAILGTDGYVASSSLHLRHLRGRVAAEMAGGPLASLLLSFVALCLLLAGPGTAWESWWKVAGMVAAMSGGAALLNVVPFGVAAGYSDGARLVQLYKGGPYADFLLAMKVVSTTIETQARPRDLDPDVLAKGANAGIGGQEEGTLRLIELICAVDRGDLDKARQLLALGLQWIPSADRAEDPVAAAETAFYLAYLDGNAGRAAQWLSDAERLAQAGQVSLANEFDYWLAVAAVRAAEARWAESEEAWQRAAVLIDQKPQTGLYRYERDLLEQTRDRAWLQAPPLLPQTAA